MTFCTGCGTALEAEGAFCARCGKAAVASATTPAPTMQGDATGGVIPYKNVPALVGYYLGVFSIIPCFPIGILGLIFGIVGYRRYRATPVIKGAIHAWLGIVAGGLFGALWTVVTALSVWASLRR